MKNTPELTETLIRALHEYVEAEIAATGEVHSVRKVLNAFGLPDETLSEVGLDWMLNDADEPEPKEPPKKTFSVHVREVWEGTFEVEASDEDEAYNLACDLEYDYDDLTLSDRDIDVSESNEDDEM